MALLTFSPLPESVTFGKFREDRPDRNASSNGSLQQVKLRESWILGYCLRGESAEGASGRWPWASVAQPRDQERKENSTAEGAAETFFFLRAYSARTSFLRSLSWGSASLHRQAMVQTRLRRSQAKTFSTMGKIVLRRCSSQNSPRSSQIQVWVIVSRASGCHCLLTAAAPVLSQDRKRSASGHFEISLYLDGKGRTGC